MRSLDRGPAQLAHRGPALCVQCLPVAHADHVVEARARIAERPHVDRLLAADVDAVVEQGVHDQRSERLRLGTRAPHPQPLTAEAAQVRLGDLAAPGVVHGV